MRFSFLVASLSLLVAACAASPDQAIGDDADVSEDELSSAPCVGTACASFPLPRAVTSGGLAVSGNRLFWIAKSETVRQYDLPVDELHSCTLPACASVSKVALLGPGGEHLSVNGFGGGLVPIDGGGVVFAAYVPLSLPTSLFMWDGATLRKVSGPLDTDHRSETAMDGKGIVTYGFRSAKIEYCPFVAQGTGPSVGACKAIAAPFRDVDAVALTPSRVLVLGRANYGSHVASFARTDLGDAKTASFKASMSGTPHFLHTAGESFFGTWQAVTSRGGRVEYDTAVVGATGSTTVAGAANIRTGTDGSRLYLAAQSQGDVFSRGGQGTIVRVSSTGKSSTVLAKGQNPAAVTVAGANVYWIDYDPNVDPSEDFVGVIRYRAR